MGKDEGGVSDNATLLIEQVQAGGSVCVDLRQFGLNIALVDWTASILKCFDGDTEVLDGLLVGFLAELVVALLFKAAQFFLELNIVSVNDGYVSLTCLCGGLLRYKLRSSRRLLDLFLGLRLGSGSRLGLFHLLDNRLRLSFCGGCRFG